MHIGEARLGLLHGGVSIGPWNPKEGENPCPPAGRALASDRGGAVHRDQDVRGMPGRQRPEHEGLLERLRTLCAAFVGALIPWGLVGVFVLTIVWTGVVAAFSTPSRYKAELDPPEVVESLPKFHSGPLTGWYVYVYVDEERVVCANPGVWDGPKVITCNHIVAIDAEVPAPAAAEAPSEPLAHRRQFDKIEDRMLDPNISFHESLDQTLAEIEASATGIEEWVDPRLATPRPPREKPRQRTSGRPPVLGPLKQRH